MLHRSVGDGNRRASEICAALEMALQSRVAEAEQKAKTSDAVIVDGFQRFSAQMLQQVELIFSVAESSHCHPAPIERYGTYSKGVAGLPQVGGIDRKVDTNATHLSGLLETQLQRLGAELSTEVNRLDAADVGVRADVAASAAAAASALATESAGLREAALGLYPIVTFQYSSTTLYQVSNHI
jgi:hypothetical protein